MSAENNLVPQKVLPFIMMMMMMMIMEYGMIEHYFSDNAVYCFLKYQLLLIKKDNDELTSKLSYSINRNVAL